MTTKLFLNGGSQAVRLPKECRLEGDEVYVKKIGDLVVLFPREKRWEIFMRGVESFSEDFAAERIGGAPEGRQTQ